MDWIDFAWPMSVGAGLALGLVYFVRWLNGLHLKFDISDRRQAEERFRQVLEGVPIAMLIIDGAGNITLANSGSERLFGYTQLELSGMPLRQLLPNVESFREGSRQRVGRGKQGEELFVELQFTPISIADQSFELVSITDISVRLHAEQEAALQRDELAHLSRVALLGELSGSLAHELNQPLTAVLSNAQAALRFLDRDPPDLHEVRVSLVEIVENDKRASEVIRRLRAMLRKEQTDYQLLGINDVVAEVFKLVNSDIHNRHVSVQFDLAPDLPMVSADRVQLQQVLLNLVINACDAMQDAEGPSTLQVRTDATADAAVHVALTDNGTGIEVADLERIFRPFVTSKNDGIGLGLAICETIIRTHGGNLWATNNPGGGATLHFVLPGAETRAVAGPTVAGDENTLPA